MARLKNDIKKGRIRMYYELQPLRIQAGWSIEYNNFSEYDMSIHGEEDCYELNEDLLQLKHIRANIIIDLGWYPPHSCDKGNYILYLIKNYDWENPLDKVMTRDKKEVIKTIEKWVCYDFIQKFI